MSRTGDTDLLQPLRQQARRELLAESRKYAARRTLEKIPSIGPIRAALLIALTQTAHRFRTKRLLWAYSGLGVKTHSSADYTFHDGRLLRSKKNVSIRGLNENHPQVALNWLLQRPTVANVIVGARTEEQLRQNLAAVGWNLTAEQVGRLTAASERVPIYPYWHLRQFVECNPLAATP